jgi:PAS domain S-box-containing protein
VGRRNDPVTRSGQSVIVASRWSLREDNQGNPGQILEINRDITDSKRAEDDLRQNRQRLALAMKAGRSGTFEWDIRNDVVVWSPEIEELYGIAPGAFAGKDESWESLVMPEDVATVISALEEALRTGEFQSEWRVRRRDDGQVRWFAGQATVSFDELGRPSRLLGINMDITDRKRAEDTLRQSEERYRALVMATFQIVWRTDSNGEGTVNPSWHAFTGQNQFQARGSGWLEAIHPDDRERCQVLWTEAFRTQTILESEYRVRRHDGEFRDMYARGVPVLSPDGSAREWVGTCTDITQQRRDREALVEKATELERSNADLQQFAYVASHDLQEPLRMVANFTQLLADRYSSQLDDDAREFMTFAVGGAVRMQAMIRDLLAYARVGAQSGTFAPVDCNEMFANAKGSLRHVISESAALITHQVLPVILGDATLITELFQNLVGNGIKFKGASPPQHPCFRGPAR